MYLLFKGHVGGRGVLVNTFVEEVARGGGWGVGEGFL